MITTRLRWTSNVNRYEQYRKIIMSTRSNGKIGSRTNHGRGLRRPCRRYQVYTAQRLGHNNNDIMICRPVNGRGRTEQTKGFVYIGPNSRLLFYFISSIPLNIYFHSISLSLCDHIPVSIFPPSLSFFLSLSVSSRF